MADNHAAKLLSKDDKMQFTWMKHKSTNFYLYVFACVFSAGIVYIWCLLHPSWKEWFLCSPSDPQEADSISTKVGNVLKVKKYFYCELFIC